MFLYIFRHAEAENAADDASRALTDKGVKDVKKTAHHLDEMGIKLDRILHSPLLRAMQTAEIFGKILKPSNDIQEADGLLPGDNPAIWANRLKDIDDNIMLVGHMPHLGMLLSLLLCGKSGREDVVRLRKAAVACLFKNGNGTWSLQWLLTPKTVK